MRQSKDAIQELPIYGQVVPEDWNVRGWAYRNLIGQDREWTPTRIPRTVSSNTNVSPLDDILLCVTTLTATLETAVGADGRRHTIFNTSTGVVTVSTQAGESINGATTLTNSMPYEGITVASNGSSWNVIRGGPREIISLLYFATGDGVTNDTAAIDLWLSRIAGKVGYVPRGFTFMTNGGHSVQSNTEIYGGGTFKLRSGVSANTRMFVNSDTSGGNTGIIMRGITLDGNRSANSATTGLDAFVGQKVTFSEFYRVKVTGFTHHCFDFSVENSDNIWQGCKLDDYGTGSIGFAVVVLSDCHRNRMIGNYVNSSLTNVGLAIDDKSGGTGGVACTGNVIASNVVVGSDIGIMVTGSHRNTVVGNTVTNPTNFGIEVTPSTDGLNDAIGNVVIGNTIHISSGVNAFGVLLAGSGNRVMGNTINRGQIGIYVQDTPAASTQTVDTFISGNYTASSSLYGIQIAGGARITVSDNDIFGTADRGITVTAVTPYSTLQGIRISGNRIKNTQQEGIVVESNGAAVVQEVVISGNIATDGGLAGTSTYPAFLIAQATSSLARVSVYDNRSIKTGVSSWARNVQVTGAPTELYVRDNLPWGYTASAVDPNTPVRLGGYFVSTLPAGVQGDTAFVTDALAPAYITAVVGGGAVVTPVFYDGTNWIAV